MMVLLPISQFQSAKSVKRFALCQASVLVISVYSYFGYYTVSFLSLINFSIDKQWENYNLLEDMKKLYNYFLCI